MYIFMFTICKYFTTIARFQEHKYAYALDTIEILGHKLFGRNIERTKKNTIDCSKIMKVVGYKQSF